MNESQLFTQCKESLKLADMETYMSDFPTGQHINLIRTWYSSAIMHAFENSSYKDRIKLCEEFRTKFDGFRTNSTETEYWSELIKRVDEERDKAKKVYVSDLRSKLGTMKSKEYAALFDKTILSDTDYSSIGVSKEIVEKLEQIGEPKKIGVESLDREAFNKGEYKIPSPCTELYLWGLPASGKSCFLSALLSTANTKKMYRGFKDISNHNSYFERLMNVFSRDGQLSTVINGTNTSSIASTRFVLNHPEHKSRCVGLIDLAGETFKSMHAYNNKEMLDDALDLCLQVTTTYLRDSKNRKLHFFIIPYNRDGEEKLIDGYSSAQFLHACSTYLVREKVIKESTDGIYVIVTKIDLMGGDPMEYEKKAEEYVISRYGSFYNSLIDICKENGISTRSDKRVRVLPFTIGKMVSREACLFDEKGALEVLDEICKKSYRERSRFRIFCDTVLGA